MFVTIADYERINNVTVPVELAEQVTVALQSAEDDLLREVGYPFYEDGPTGIAGRDWQTLASWRAQEYVDQTDPAYRAAVSGAYQSETMGRYSYTLRQPDSTMREDLRYQRVISYYIGLRTAEIQYHGANTVRDEYSR